MNWPILAVELALAALALIVLALDLVWSREQQERLGAVTTVGLLLILALWWHQRGASGTGFYGLAVLDRFAWYMKGLILGASLLVVTMTREFLRRLPGPRGELYLLLVLAATGMSLLTATADLTLLFVSLELLTFSLYVMTAYVRTDARSIEAGLKYLILGAVASASVLYGIAMLYSQTGHTRYDELTLHLMTHPPTPAVLLGMLLILSGLGFKIAMVPFHLWVPDVYEGAPTPVAAFLAVGSKTAGFAALLRLLLTTLQPLHAQWTWVLAALSGATMLYGNLAALPQKNIKRLLGYSSIGHVGYLLMGLSSASVLGTAGVLFYLLAYLLMTGAAFLVVVAVSQRIGSDRIEDYAGLSQRSPFLAAAMFVALMSLAGVPPLAGFFGKFLLILSAVQGQLFWLAAIGAVNVVISLYYYLLVIKQIYLRPAREDTELTVGLPYRFVLYACLAGILGVGIFQRPFLALATTAIQSWF
ncbi:MAG: NADH-quinone oxidoreductase subunit N [Candidatus Omnitrophica bacterium]|nr:NADH-quinone oxidoreductase subunit N [Candidatus Omnitrophota bacterium]